MSDPTKDKQIEELARTLQDTRQSLNATREEMARERNSWIEYLKKQKELSRQIAEMIYSEWNQPQLIEHIKNIPQIKSALKDLSENPK